jgi:hypothetical protein
MGELTLEHFRKPEPKPEPVLEDLGTKQLVVDPLNDACRARDGEILLPEKSDLRPPLPIAIRSINPQKIASRVDLMREIMPTIPLNEFNLPIYIYRADLLNFTLVVDEGLEDRTKTLQEMLDNATISINYAMGFPTFSEMTPIWGQLPYESKEAFQAFLVYLDQAGARTLHQMPAYSLDDLNEWFYLCYWHFRAVAYDMYRIAHHNRMREQRIMTLEGRHFERAEKMFEKFAQAIENLDADQLKGASLNELMGALEKAAKLQRISLGLSAQGGEKKETSGTSVEVTMRQVAQKDGTRTTEAEDVGMAEILSDPDAIASAQELILRVNKS